MSKVIPSRYKICKTLREIHKVISYVKATGICSVDFETDGKPYENVNSVPTVIGISFQPGFSYVIPLAHFDSPFLKDEQWVDILHLLGREIFHNTKVVKIAQNIKFEIKWLKKYGIEMHGVILDTMLAHYLLDENARHGLKEMVRQYIPGFSDYEEEVDILKKKHGGWDKIPLKPLCKYNGLDCDLTLRLMMYFQTKLIKNNFYQLFRNLLMMATKVLSESEFHGMRIDEPYLDDIIEKYNQKIIDKEKQILDHPFIRKYQQKARKAHINKLIDGVTDEIYALKKKGAPNADKLISARNDKIRRYLSGELTTKKERYEGLNLGSPKQLLDLFYNSKYGFRFPEQKKKTNKKDKWGKTIYSASTDEPSMLKLKALKVKDHGFLDNLMDLRGLQKLYSTYMVGMKEILDENHMIHASYHLMTVTGRLGCREPNMQNIPRVLTNPDVKPMFKPFAGKLHFEVDYSQAELRVVAELAKDKAMIDIFKRGYNIHVATACIANGVLDQYDEVRKIIKDENHPKNEFWEREKKKAKTINFGILYGQGPEKLAEGMGTSVEEAKAFTKKWFAAYPGVKKWIAAQQKHAKEHGYVYNIFGRKRRLPDIWSSVSHFQQEAQRQSVNAPIQGAASDFTQLSTIVLRDMRLRGKLPRYFIQRYTVHDSIGFYIEPADVKWITPLVVKVCSNPDTKKYFGFRMKYVDMKVSPEIGTNWADLKDCFPDEDYSKLLKVA